MTTHVCRRWLVFGLAALPGLLAAPARAALLPVGFEPNGPALLSVDGSLTYDLSTGAFRAGADNLALAGAAVRSELALFDPSTGGRTAVELFVNPAGGFAGGGAGVRVVGALDLDGDGTVDLTGTAADPLLFGSITAFGADSAGPPSRAFNGLFEIAGGRLTGPVTLSGGGTAEVGFTLGRTGLFVVEAENVATGTLGNFGSAFSSGSVKITVGVASIPEPAAVVSALSGAVLLVLLGRAARRGHVVAS